MESPHQVGDRIRDKATRQAGTIRAVEDGLLVITVAEGGELRCAPDAVTNFSLMARRAWVTRRKTGGQHDDPLEHVTLRVRRSLWEALGAARKSGKLTVSRAALINQHLEQVARALGIWPPPEE